MQIVYVWVLKPTKPYRLYLRKDTGYWYYRLPDAGKWKSTDRAKENDAHDFVIKNVLAEGKASPTLKEFAESTFDAYAKAKRKTRRPLSTQYVTSARNYIKRFYRTIRLPKSRRPTCLVMIIKNFKIA